jgi:hypothetical protein
MENKLNGWCPHGIPGAVGCVKCESAAEEGRVAALQTTNTTKAKISPCQDCEFDNGGCSDKPYRSCIGCRRFYATD